MRDVVDAQRAYDDETRRQDRGEISYRDDRIAERLRGAEEDLLSALDARACTYVASLGR